jgi:hypothetical protein
VKAAEEDEAMRNDDGGSHRIRIGRREPARQDTTEKGIHEEETLTKKRRKRSSEKCVRTQTSEESESGQRDTSSCDRTVRVSSSPPWPQLTAQGTQRGQSERTGKGPHEASAAAGERELDHTAAWCDALASDGEWWRNERCARKRER